MSIHIDSETRVSGERYQGAWQFYTSLIGSYEVIDQYVDAKPIPWITGNANLVSITTNDQTLIFQLFDNVGEEDTDLELFSVIDDLDIIAAYIETRFNDISTQHSYGWTCTVTVEEDTPLLRLDFSEDIRINYSGMTSGGIWEHGNVDLTSDSFYWSTRNIDLHPHLYVKIPEIATEIVEPDIDYAAFIFHTENNPLNGMRIQIKERTNVFNITIYRKSMSSIPLPIRNKWDLILKPM